jgi:hypothetical protein
MFTAITLSLCCSYLKATKMFDVPPLMASVDGTYSIVNNSGYVFLFNPFATARPALNMSVTRRFGFDPASASPFFRVTQLDVDHLGPVQGNRSDVALVSYGQAIPFPELDGRSATVYYIQPVEVRVKCVHVGCVLSC